MNRAERPRFEYVTEWHFDAPVEAVWEALADVERWPQWWPHVRAVRTLERGGLRGHGTVHRIRWSSRLPYGFTIDVRTIDSLAPLRLHGRATGDMAGVGLWQLRREGPCTHLRYTWNLALHRRWMRLLAPLLAPVFRWNHEGVMRAGMRGLEKRLLHPRGQAVRA